MSNRYLVIMAGGIGSRFWPMSRQHHPKQFIDILGVGETLLQGTYRRAKELFDDEHILVVTNEDYTALVKEQLPGIPWMNILSEPSRKNTAPCIAYAAFKILKRDPDAIMFVAPSDQLITREGEFNKVVRKGIDYASANDVLLTIGIRPSRPETGYGYIQFSTNGNMSGAIRPVKTFTEKPSHELAQQFVQSGEFLWNSGMFIWKTSVFIQAFETFMQEDYAVFADFADDFDVDRKEDKAIQKIYGEVRNISVDYGIMEKASNVEVLIADLGWSDLGTWGSLYEHINNGQLNAIVGNNVLSYDSANNIIHMPKDKLVVIQGLHGFIVAESENALLICRLADEQKIKNLVNEVRIEKGDQFL